MANLKIQRSNAPDVESPLVPQKGISVPNANANAFGAPLASALGQTAGALRVYQDRMERTELSGAQARYSDWQYETQKGLADMRRASHPEESNRFERENAFIDAQQKKFTDSLDPKHRARFTPSVAESGNRMRRGSLRYDSDAKAEFFTTRANEIIRQHSRILDIAKSDPNNLNAAFKELEDTIRTSSKDLSIADQQKLIEKGRAILKEVAYGRALYDEKTQGPEWAARNMDHLLGIIGGAESGSRWMPPGRQYTDRIKTFHVYRGKQARNLPIQSNVDLMARQAAVKTAIRMGVNPDDIQLVYTSGGQPDKGPGRKGSHRHDWGRAVDLQIQIRGSDGKFRTITPRSHRDWYLTFAEEVGPDAAGSVGNGHYDWGLHIGGGKRADWGPDTTSGTLAGDFKRAFGRYRGKSTSIKSGSSSASGTWQILDGTFTQWIKEEAPELESLIHGGNVNLATLKKDPVYQRRAAEWYVRKITKQLHDHRLPVNAASIYMGWFGGAGKVVKLMTARPDEAITKYFSAKEIKANPGVFKHVKTVGDYRDWAARKTSQTSHRSGVAGDPRYGGLDRSAYRRAEADANRRWARDEQERLDVASLQRRTFMNDLMLGIATGTQGETQIQMGLATGMIKSYDDFRKATVALDRYNKGLAGQRLLSDLRSKNSAFDPTNTKQVKALNEEGRRLFDEAIVKKHPGVSAGLIEFSSQYQGQLPTSTVKTLGAMLATDSGSARYALATMHTLSQHGLAPALQKGLTDDQYKQVTQYGSRADALSDSQWENFWSQRMSPQRREALKVMRAEGEDQFEDVRKEADTPSAFRAETLEKMFDGETVGLSSVDRGAFMTDFKQTYGDVYSMSDGEDAEVIMEKTLEMMRNRWSVFTNSRGHKRAMRYSPGATHPYPAKDFDRYINVEMNQDKKKGGLIGTYLPGLPGGYIKPGDDIILFGDKNTAADAQAIKKWERDIAAGKEVGPRPEVDWNYGVVRDGSTYMMPSTVKDSRYYLSTALWDAASYQEEQGRLAELQAGLRTARAGVDITMEPGLRHIEQPEVIERSTDETFVSPGTEERRSKIPEVEAKMIAKTIAMFEKLKEDKRISDFRRGEIGQSLKKWKEELEIFKGERDQPSEQDEVISADDDLLGAQ